MSWDIHIERSQNGYICTSEQDEEKTKVIFEEQDDDEGGLNATCNMLFYVMEYFGIHYSKHNSRNLRISIEETDK